MEQQRVGFLEPLLLQGSVGPLLVSLKVLLQTPWDMKDLPLILALVPSCRELRIMAPSRGFTYEEAGSIQPLKDLMQPAHWPPTIQILELHVIKGGQSLTLLAEAFSSGTLPMLRELYLKNIEGDTLEEGPSACLGRALMKSGGKIETLHLRLSGIEDLYVDLVSHMLGLHVEDPLNESFGSLKVLMIEQDFMDWAWLGTAILRGRFPQLREIQRADPSTSFWFEVSPECTELWFEMITSRHLEAFGDRLCYGFSSLDRPPLLHLLSGLSVVQQDLTSCICDVSLRVPLDDETCNALARAISSKNLRTMTSLRFGVGINFHSTSMENLGRVIHPSFVPHFEELNLPNVNKAEEDIYICPQLWRSFFGSMPVEGHGLLRTLSIGSYRWGPKGILVILQALGAPGIPIIMNNVTALEMHDEITIDDLMALSSAILAGVFPSLVKLQFHGKCRNESLSFHPLRSNLEV